MKGKGIVQGSGFRAHRAWCRCGVPAVHLVLLLAAATCRHRAANRAPLAQLGGVAIVSGYAYPTAGDAGAAYLALRGTGDQPDTLVEVSSPADGNGMLMGTRNGQMTMVSTLEIPARGEVRMHPGAVHLMFEGMKHSYGIGDTLELRLRFARAGEVSVRVPVVAYGEMPE